MSFHSRSPAEAGFGSLSPALLPPAQAGGNPASPRLQRGYAGQAGSSPASRNHQYRGDGTLVVLDVSEDHAASRGLEHAGDADVELLADAVAAVVDDDHGAVVE